MKSSFIKTRFGVLALALALSAGNATAGWRTGYEQPYLHELDARQDRQHERIDAGRERGELTRTEFRRLKREQREIRALVRHFAADGVLDARERRRLDRALDRASHNIRAARHDHDGVATGTPYSRVAWGR